MKNSKYNGGFYIVLALCIVAVGAVGYVNLEEQRQLTLVNDVQDVEIERVEVIPDQTPTIERIDTPIEVLTETVSSEEKIEKVEETVQKVEDKVYEEVENTQPQATVTVAPVVEITKVEEIYVRPCDGGVINGNSNDELVKNVSMNDWRTHNATDYSVSVGQNIVAIANGEVTAIETNDQYATIITIEHSDGLITKTCGLNSDTVAKIGDKVVAGDVIGTAVGTFPAEINEGNHIHVEATKNGQNFDLETLFS